MYAVAPDSENHQYYRHDMNQRRSVLDDDLLELQCSMGAVSVEG